MKKFSIQESSKKYVELSAPLKIYYDITTKCNLDCIFCFKGKCRSDVTWEQAQDIIKKIADANIPDIIFIGGEPMCCSFMFPALQYARGLGLNPGIVTNGTHFTDANAAQLKILVNNSISVSVHAPNNTLHDKISHGKNVYTKIIEGLHILNKHGIVPELSFTPVKDNIEYLFETIDGILQKDIQISDILVNRLIPSGNALYCWQDKEFGLKGQIRLFEQMEELSKKYPQIVITTGDAIPFCMVEEKYRRFITRCDYAITLGWINDQNLFGKCMVRGSIGAEDLKNNDLRDLWKHSGAFLQHRHMKNLPTECQNCSWLMRCGGGCACSDIDKINKDAYLNTNLKYSMPPIEDGEDCFNKISISSIDFKKVDLAARYKIKIRFHIRRERSRMDDLDEVYLFLPESSGAVIQDVITSDSGSILWLNEIEKQVVMYMQLALTVTEVAKCIAYEFVINLEEALSQVKNTIVALKTLDMVEEI